jgi:5-methylcytosine-specific restriction endonuclease McrA
MAYSDEDLNYVYDKNDGYCWWCGKKLSFVNYGCPGAHGAWEVDHSNPVVQGGSDLLRNLLPACIPCNRSKGGQRWR